MRSDGRAIYMEPSQEAGPLESRKSSRSRIRGGEGRTRGAGGVSAWIGNRERRNRGTRREAVRTGRSS